MENSKVIYTCSQCNKTIPCVLLEGAVKPSEICSECGAVHSAQQQMIEIKEDNRVMLND